MKQVMLLIMALLFGGAAFAQGTAPQETPGTGTRVANPAKKVTLSGYIKDARSGEVLIGATAFIQELENGAVTNVYGFYSLSVEPGTYTVIYSYVGFQNQTRTVDLTADLTVNMELREQETQLDEVVVSAERLENNRVEQVEMSTAKLSMQQVKKMPQLMGENDIIRSIQLLPGVSSVGEGASGFNVRGGSIDQNLILLDEAPVYSSSHLFGFFSVFNADAIKDVKLYKGGIPAPYGGRLSSVLDVRQREGNMKQFEGSGGIGIISSRLTLEGPLKRDKASFIVSGRRSYGDLFLKLSNDPDLNNNTVYFYDLNAKVNWIMNDKNRFYVAGYLGSDVLKPGPDFSMRWGNKTGTLRWNHLFNQKLFSNFTAVYSDYEYNFRINNEALGFDWTSNIINYNLKADFIWYPTPSNTVEFGTSTIYYTFKPGDFQTISEASAFTPFQLDDQYAVEPAVYASNEQKIGNRLTLQYGLRASAFYRLGEGTAYIYDPNHPKSAETIIDTVQYGRGEVMSKFWGLEPRFSANYKLNDQSSLKLSYNRMRQNIHLISNTTAATPLDVWSPAGPHINPALADQIAAGYVRNFDENRYEFSVETYYKYFQDLVDYRDGAELLLNRTLEADLLRGDGRAYGVELLLRKQEGRLTGWIGYTLSRSERLVTAAMNGDRGFTPQEKKEISINNGTYYPSNWDKTHDVTVVAAYQLSENWSINSNFSFMTGRPITFPNGRAEWEGVVFPVYDNRNGARTPVYHRLDFGATWERPNDENKRFHSSWTFSLYNVYARRNPYSIYFQQVPDGDAFQTQAYRLSIFGSVIPGITWNFNF
ncbi:Outer membrane receptor proteins, mostly Fe transport [Catalinimonas alkaloidigena]|uniref:Outer membrane receptor proteins, mostly Fe transport n=1 Tax=Catalinimonas alkaloidigena TaxID=1075417 RepID=A0A1G9H8H1_9BACT|nr:TonB-dependent receptor [Catalinimonas alkaloidigena]SDL09281.1 Outer membrane receptor proteins, mostly Fe transport [Catalinimonas alkaloidigena]